MKLEPHNFVVTLNPMNSSGFETWRGLHATYDQGQQTQKLQKNQRILNPTWNNESQQPQDFIRWFNLGKDEIFQYDETNGDALDDNVRMTVLLSRLKDQY
eukprot:5383893-Amphidinium_carterae.2